jgi:hypothetical protein
MDEEQLIELLGELRPRWRDSYRDPWEAADALGIDYDEDAGDDLEELDFS